MMSYGEFLQYAIHRHDVECNQKYDEALPYSAHLRMVIRQATRFAFCGRTLVRGEHNFDEVMMICAGHDLIEDARVTYNDIVARTNHYVAEGIFLCTELRGRNRSERKSDLYYEQLSEHGGAVFAKLCDIAANSLYSLATHSSMFAAYQGEWRRKCHLLNRWNTPDRLSEMFDFLDRLYIVTDNHERLASST